MKIKSCGEEGSYLVLTNEDLREIYLFGEIGNGMSCQFIAMLREMDAASSRPIKLLINSVGGEIFSGVAIYDAICLARSRVIGMAFGACMSAAAMILQSCDTRLVSPTCRFMVHNPYTDTGEGADVRDMRKNLKETRYVTDLYYEKMAEKSSITLDKIRKMCEDTTYLSAQETVDYGFADAIIK